MDKKTPLHEWHLKSDAKMVSFAGFDMPVQYAGIQKEHEAVRKNVGLFDVSHMGNVLVTGDKALEYLQNITVNDVSKLFPMEVQYSAFCYDNGTVIDDILVTYLEPNAYHVVINASNIEKDLSWMEKHLIEGVNLKNQSEDLCILALQGPNAIKVAQKLTTVNLNEIGTYKAGAGTVGDVKMVFSRTGYTGEDGFEFFPKYKDGLALWEKIMEAGEEFGIQPIGLGARDTLRLEAGYSLYGHELTDQTNLVEASLSWIVNWDGADFVGKKALVECKAAGPSRKIMGIELLERAIPREGYSIEKEGKVIGVVTSGTMSPTSGKGIALAYIQMEFAKKDVEVDLIVRNQKKKAKVVSRYFYRREKK